MSESTPTPPWMPPPKPTQTSELAHMLGADDDQSANETGPNDQAGGGTNVLFIFGDKKSSTGDESTEVTEPEEKWTQVIDPMEADLADQSGGGWTLAVDDAPEILDEGFF